MSIRSNGHATTIVHWTVYHGLIQNIGEKIQKACREASKRLVPMMSLNNNIPGGEHLPCHSQGSI